MRKWHAAVCCIILWSIPTPTANFRTQEMSLIPAKFEPTPKTVTPKTAAPKMIPNSIAVFFGQTKVKTEGVGVSVKPADDGQLVKDNTSPRTISIIHSSYKDHPKPPDSQRTRTPVLHAGPPEKLNVSYLPYDTGEYSENIVKFNVSWIPYMGIETSSYSLEVSSMTNTSYCNTTMCGDSPISGNATWRVPQSSDLKPCAFRPGCTYWVQLTSHFRNVAAASSTTVELAECVAGVCSCAHQLPKPNVTEVTTSIQNDTVFVNVSWSLPATSDPQILDKKLTKKYYLVFIARQPPGAINHLNFKLWKVKADGLVSEGEHKSFTLNFTREDIPKKGNATISHLTFWSYSYKARVTLTDERGCSGHEGEKIFKLAVKKADPEPEPDPVEPSIWKFSSGAYAILVALIGAWAMGAMFVLSARVVKRVLKSFRSAPVSAPLEPLRCRPAWFPLQLRTNFQQLSLGPGPQRMFLTGS